MTAPTKADIETALAAWQDPWMGADPVAAGAVRDIEVENRNARVVLELGYPAKAVAEALRDSLTAHLQTTVPELETVKVEISWQVLSHAVQHNLAPLQGVKNIIAVASGKGGVGKSTVAVNLALALAADGARTGILDADIYGPSQPCMLGLSGRPESRDGKHITPMSGHGIDCMSIGFLIDEETPMVWRGPMATQALVQLIQDTEWRDLDYLVVDMPPGTGDIQLTLAQRVPVSGAVIITTPQEIAVLDARKGLEMFRKVNVNILGIVENMSTHVCSNCGHEEAIFGEGGGERLAELYDVSFLGSLPLNLAIREQTDNGNPTVAAEPDGPLARGFREAARRAAAQLALVGKDYAGAFPKIVIED